MRSRTIATAGLLLLVSAIASRGAEKVSDKPDPEMLRMMELLRDWEMLKNMELLKEMQRVGGEAKGGPSTAQNSLPAKQKENAK